MKNRKEKIKRIPYGISDFEIMIKEEYYYIDKTKFIEEIERSPRYLFFIRPRRFGKSLWLSLLECYYDIEKKEDFESLFSGTYIYDNPTDEKNSYFILKFNFSSVKSEVDKLEHSFNYTIKLSALKFIKKYEKYLSSKNDRMYDILENLDDASEILKYINSLVEGNGKIYLLIDEYDNFTNTIISSSGEVRYRAITHGEGFYRHFFNVIKAGTTGSGAPISKLFITGVSPVTMDDVTSGFNIGTNITTNPKFNEMAGFTEKEIIDMLAYFKESNLIEGNPFNIIDKMKPWYNNYLFSKYSAVRIYNSDMALYFINQYIDFNIVPEDMLDHNIKMDYKKLRYLVINDFKGRLKVNGNFEKMKIILEEGEISSDIASSFPAHRIIDPNNFISLLYYLGLLTIKGVKYGMPLLAIPNESIRQIYYEYVREAYRDTDIFNIDLFKLATLFRDMAYKGKWEDLIDYISIEMNNQTSLRDYIKGEKSVQTFLRAYLNLSNYYITKTETELNKGYCDILMSPNLYSFPDMTSSYLFEIKYIKVSDFSENVLKKKIEEAKEELDKYIKDFDLKKIAGSTSLHKIVLVFCGVELKHKELY